MTAASESGSGTWSRNFGYDQWGNMAVTGNSGVPFNGLTPYGSGQYNTANNRLVSGLVAYDASGNTTSLSTMRMGYTAENQFWIAYDVNSGVTVEYLPDGFGNRVWKQVTGGATTYYLYDALGQLAAEYTGPTALTKEYIRMGGQLIAIQNASGTPCSTCYLTYDHLGSVRLVTDQNANIVSRHDFLPFGEEIPAGYAGRWSQFGASDKINQRFTGQDRETENIVSVDYFNARNFTGVLGRFNSPDPGNIGADPANPESWNGYAYVGNNPLSAVDPSGMCEPLGDTANFEPNSDYCAILGSPDGGSGVDPIQVSCPGCNVTVNGGTPDPVDPDPASTPFCLWGCSTFFTTGFGHQNVPTQGSTSQFSLTLTSAAPSKTGTRNCSAGPASAGQYLAATAQVALLTGQFFSGLGSANQTFGPNTATSQVVAQSGPVQDVLNEYYMTGRTSDLYTFGATGYVAAGANPMAQFVGSFRWAITPGNGGINLTLTNTTSFKSLTYDKGPQWQRGRVPTPMGNTHQTYKIFVPCKG